jgi:hypothetical protein
MKLFRILASLALLLAPIAASATAQPLGRSWALDDGAGGTIYTGSVLAPRDFTGTYIIDPFTFYWTFTGALHLTPAGGSTTDYAGFFTITYHKDDGLTSPWVSLTGTGPSIDFSTIRYFASDPWPVFDSNILMPGQAGEFNAPGLAHAPVTWLTVPEPSTWAMLLAGFALAGVSLRRRVSARPCTL